MITVSIIGTSGRGCLNAMNKKIYKKMIIKTKDIIENHFKLDPKNICLVSGGAAWADHVVVKLYLDKYVSNALLYLPCQWNHVSGKYVDRIQDHHNVAHIANQYHDLFSKKMKCNTLYEIQKAINQGLIINTSNYGFKNRNIEVAKSDYLIAFTWNRVIPQKGGTAHTWKNTTTPQKIHINLENL